MENCCGLTRQPLIHEPTSIYSHTRKETEKAEAIHGWEATGWGDVYLDIREMTLSQG